MSAKALKYTARAAPGEPLNFSMEDSKLPSPSNKQALVRFLAAAISPSDYRIMTASGEPSRNAGVRDVTKRFAKAKAVCLLYTSPSPRDVEESRMPSSA